MMLTEKRYPLAILAVFENLPVSIHR